MRVSYSACVELESRAERPAGYADAVRAAALAVDGDFLTLAPTTYVALARGERPERPTDPKVLEIISRQEASGGCCG
jgi:hypothetical protein